MVHTRSHARHWGAYIAAGIGLLVVLALVGWALHPRYPDIASRSTADAPRHDYTAGGDSCRPDRLRLLPDNSYGSSERARCAEAEEEKQRIQDATSETRYASDISKQALLVAEYQGWTFFWQALAAIGALLAASIAALYAKRAVDETRRIGEAQARAYVSARSIKGEFLVTKAFPMIELTVSNSGQSPARNFVWRAIIQYNPRGPFFYEAASHASLDDRSGVEIPATTEFGGLKTFIQNASVADCVVKSAPGTVIFESRIKIEFKFRDVFGIDHFGEAYFFGAVSRRPLTPEQVGLGESGWAGLFELVPEPDDWDGILGVEETQWNYRRRQHKERHADD